MQNPWFPLYVADYLAKTSHLSQAQHGAYMLLMIHYYATLKPIPSDAGVLQRVCRAFADEEMACVRTVLDSFFTLDGNCYRHERIDEEIAKRLDISTKRQKAAAKRHALPPLQMHTQSQSQSYIEPKPKSKAHSAFVIPDWIPSEAWKHYEEMRCKIRKPMTDTARKWAVEALNRLRVKGYDPSEVLEQSVFNSWQGLFEVKHDSNSQTTGYGVGGRNTATSAGLGTQAQRAVNNAHALGTALGWNTTSDRPGQAARPSGRNTPLLGGEVEKIP